jgi:hypothetical protein
MGGRGKTSLGMSNYQQFNNRDADMWLRQNKWIPNLTTAEQNIAIHWQDPRGYKLINNNARGLDASWMRPSSKEIESANQTSKVLDNLISRSTIKESVQVFRGMHGLLAQQIIAKIESGQLKPGSKLSDKGFVATSLGPNRADHFVRMNDDPNKVLLKINIPKGTHCINQQEASGMNIGETEILLGRNTNLHLDSFEQKNGVWHINATVK